MTSSPIYFGIDVAKAKLDLATEDVYLGVFPNTPKGFDRIIAELDDYHVALVTIESTGIYSRLVANHLHQAGYRVLLVQPGRVRRYAQSRGTKAKTDKIDSSMIAAYGASLKQKDRRLYQPPKEELRALRALVDRRVQVVDLITKEKNHLEACQDREVIKHIRSLIKHLQTLRCKLDKRIAAAIAANEDLAQRRRVLVSLYGIADTSAAVLLTHLPELGRLNRQEVAALAGVACYDRSSGNSDRRRSIYGGRATARRTMYLCGRVAKQAGGPLHEFYTRMRARGKLKKVATIACARKLLIRANSAMREYLDAQEDSNAGCAPSCSG